MIDRPTDEQLSAYLDGELEASELARVELLLRQSPEAQQRLDALREVVSGLRQMDRLAPPEELAMAVSRRVVVSPASSWSSRLGLPRSYKSLQPSSVVLSAVVIAMAVIGMLFVQRLAQEEERDPGVGPEVYETQGRLFRLDGPVWIEEGTENKEARQVGSWTAEGRDLERSFPWLLEFPQPQGVDGRAVRFVLNDEVVEWVAGRTAES